MSHNLKKSYLSMQILPYRDRLIFSQAARHRDVAYCYTRPTFCGECVIDKMDELIEMPLGGHSCWPKKPSIRWECTLAPPGEYERTIIALRRCGFVTSICHHIEFGTKKRNQPWANCVYRWVRIWEMQLGKLFLLINSRPLHEMYFKRPVSFVLSDRSGGFHHCMKCPSIMLSWHNTVLLSVRLP